MIDRDGVEIFVDDVDQEHAGHLVRGNHARGRSRDGYEVGVRVVVAHENALLRHFGQLEIDVVDLDLALSLESHLVVLQILWEIIQNSD